MVLHLVAHVFSVHAFDPCLNFAQQPLLRGLTIHLQIYSYSIAYYLKKHEHTPCLFPAAKHFYSARTRGSTPRSIVLAPCVHLPELRAMHTPRIGGHAILFRDELKALVQCHSASIGDGQTETQVGLEVDVSPPACMRTKRQSETRRQFKPARESGLLKEVTL